MVVEVRGSSPLQRGMGSAQQGGSKGAVTPPTLQRLLFDVAGGVVRWRHGGGGTVGWRQIGSRLIAGLGFRLLIRYWTKISFLEGPTQKEGDKKDNSDIKDFFSS